MNVRKKRAAALGARAMLTGGLTIACAGAGAVWSPAAWSQTVSAIPDAQVEANVLKAMANAPELSTQDIQSSTVYGVVTLSGTVQTEALRTRAENLAARASGVKKVVDELALGTPADASNTASVSAEDGQSSPGQGGNGQPVLQSDGTYASAQPAQPASPYAGPPAQAPPQTVNGTPIGGAGNAQPNYPQQPNQQPAYGQQSNGSYSQPRYPQPAPGYGQPGYPQQNYPQQGYTQGQPYPPPGYAPQGGQAAGVAVTVPSGALLRVRINRGLDSNHIQPGTAFDGTVLSDVAGDGVIAIPRGAAVQGVVVDAKKAGALKGEGQLTLQINSVSLAGTSYPLQSDLWQRQGRDKTVGTVNSALGLGVLGAIIGGVAGGGAGAAVGAGVGAGAGVAGSAASPGGRVIVPPEAVLSFHVAQPAQVLTVSEGEMQRLAYAAGPGQGPGGQQVVRRRYYAPGPYQYPY